MNAKGIYTIPSVAISGVEPISHRQPASQKCSSGCCLDERTKGIFIYDVLCFVQAICDLKKKEYSFVLICNVLIAYLRLYLLSPNQSKKMFGLIVF